MLYRTYILLFRWQCFKQIGVYHVHTKIINTVSDIWHETTALKSFVFVGFTYTEARPQLYTNLSNTNDEVCKLFSKQCTFTKTCLTV